MKTIYKNTIGEEVKIKLDQGYCILNVTDEDKNISEICILKKYAIEIAKKIIEECKLSKD